MNPHFFTAPFYFTLLYFTLLYFALIWFRVQGSRFKVQVAASLPFLEDGLVSQPSPLGRCY